MRMFKKILYIFIAAITMCPVFLGALFEQDRAAIKMDHKDWTAALTLLQKKIIQDPENIELLYDAGVASYRLKEFEHAQAYFEKAAGQKDSYAGLDQDSNIFREIQELRKKAYFNAGNAAAAQKKYEQALEKYRQVLALEPEHKKAQENYQKVEQLLKQKQEEKKQENTQDKNNKDQKSQENTQDKNNKQKQEQESQENNKQENNNKDKDSQDQEEQKQENKQENNKQDQDSQEQEEQKQENTQDKNNKQEQESQEKKEQENKQEKSAYQKAEEVKDGPEKENPYSQDAWLTGVLDKQEQNDKAAVKQMIEQRVGNTMVGQDGQNNW